MTLNTATVTAPVVNQQGLIANANDGSSYEIIPGSNEISLPGAAGTPTLFVEEPAQFTVSNSGFTSVTVNFYCLLQ